MKKRTHIQVILGLTKTVKFVKIYCPLVSMCSVLLVYYSLIFFETEHQPSYSSRSRSQSVDFFNPSESTTKIKRSYSARSLDLLSIDDDLDLCGREETEASESLSCSCYPVSLDTCYDIISDTDAFQVCVCFKTGR